MTSNNHPEPSSYVTSADLRLATSTLEHSQSLTTTAVDRDWSDEEVFRRFASGRSRSISNQNFQIQYTHNALQLSTPKGELVAIHKVSERLHYILVKKDNDYLDRIQTIITEYQFVPLDTATADRRFVRYQRYEIPEGYTLRYEPAEELWQTWQTWLTNHHQSDDGVRLDILVQAKSKWYRVQDTIRADDRLDIKTRLGLISLHLRDKLAWIVKFGDIPPINNADLADRQNGLDSETDSEILGKIITKLALEPSDDADGDVQFNPYITMTASVAGSERDLSALGERDTGTLTANLVEPSKSSLLSLQTAAFQAIEDYLERGEIIVRTEVVKDAQGNITSEKTVTTHRSCPRWAIEVALDWH